MAGKKDNAIVAVIGELTKNQAAEITKEIIKAKAKYAANSRGTISSCSMEHIGRLIQSGRKRIGG